MRHHSRATAGHFKLVLWGTWAFYCPELWMSTAFLSSALTTFFPANLAPKAVDSSRDPPCARWALLPAVRPFTSFLPTPPNHVISLPLKLIKWQNSSTGDAFRPGYPLRRLPGKCAAAKRIDAPRRTIKCRLDNSRNEFQFIKLYRVPEAFMVMK